MIPIDSLPVNITILRYVEGDFIFVKLNNQTEKTEHIKREEVIGKKLQEVFPNVEMFGILEVLKRVYTTGTAEHFEAAYYQDEFRDGWRVNHISLLENKDILLVYNDVTREVELTHSLESLGTLIDQSLHEIYIVDLKTLLFTYANRCAIENIGYTTNELLNMTPADINAEFDFKKIQNMCKPLLEGTISQLTIETKNRRKNGTTYPVEVRVHKMNYLGEEHFIVYCLDTSERIKNQNEILKLHHIIAQSDDLIMITDRDGIIEYVNDAYVKLTGWRKEDFLGSKPSVLKSELNSNEFYQNIWDTILSGETYKGNIQNRKKDGSLYWEEKTITPIKLEYDDVTHFISTGKDITKQIHLQQELKEREHLFKTLTENAVSGIFLYRGKFIYVNDSFAKMTHYTPEELQNMTPESLLEPNERIRMKHDLKLKLNGNLEEKIIFDDAKIVTGAGEKRWFYIALATVKFEGRWTTLGTAVDITERKTLEKKLKYYAQTDVLTGLYNRLTFDDIIQREISYAKRHEKKISLIYMDIDNFKQINDTYGHDAGDEVLKELARIVKELLRISDYPFRWGGEEFVILCPGTTLEEIAALSERLRKKISQNHFSSVEKVTVSMGITEYREDEEVDRMIQRADKALYTAKEEGRNKIVSI